MPPISMAILFPASGGEWRDHPGCFWTRVFVPTPASASGDYTVSVTVSDGDADHADCLAHHAQPRRQARVVFDESHNEVDTLDDATANQTSPGHPEYVSLATLAGSSGKSTRSPGWGASMLYPVRCCAARMWSFCEAVGSAHQRGEQARSWSSLMPEAECSACSTSIRAWPRRTFILDRQDQTRRNRDQDVLEPHSEWRSRCILPEQYGEPSGDSPGRASM